jgi:hypothetical protein
MTVMSLPGVPAQRRGSPAEHGIDISHETVGLVESFLARCSPPGSAKGASRHSRLSSVVVMRLLKRIMRGG